jgi:hypothetical protein
MTDSLWGKDTISAFLKKKKNVARGARLDFFLVFTAVMGPSSENSRKIVYGNLLWRTPGNKRVFDVRLP